jgi:hypothetical protein
VRTYSRRGSSVWRERERPKNVVSRSKLEAAVEAERRDHARLALRRPSLIGLASVR